MDPTLLLSVGLPVSYTAGYFWSWRRIFTLIWRSKPPNDAYRRNGGDLTGVIFCTSLLSIIWPFALPFTRLRSTTKAGVPAIADKLCYTPRTERRKQQEQEALRRLHEAEEAVGLEPYDFD